MCWHQILWLHPFYWPSHQHRPPVLKTWRKPLKSTLKTFKHSLGDLRKYSFGLFANTWHEQPHAGEWEEVNHKWQWHIYMMHLSSWDYMWLTKAPSSLKIAEEPMWSDGTIFLLQRRRRNVSEERSFLWNFQPIRDEYSQPSPGSRLCSRDNKKLN